MPEFDNWSMAAADDQAAHAQIGCSPENLTTLAHFSVSSATRLAIADGGPPITAAPRSGNRALNFGSTKTSLATVLSLPMISAEVFFGAPMPYQVVIS